VNVLAECCIATNPARDTDKLHSHFIITTLAWYTSTNTFLKGNKIAVYGIFDSASDVDNVHLINDCIVTTSAKVTFPLCLSAGLDKKHLTNFHKIRWKVAHGPQKNHDILMVI